jgi:TonB family protein
MYPTRISPLRAVSIALPLIFLSAGTAPMTTTANTAAVDSVKPANAENGEKSVIDIGALSSRPTIVSRADPRYPISLRRQGISGEAVVEFIVDEKGVTRNHTVIKATDPAFGVAAIEALSRWKYKPGIKDGKAVRTRMRVPVVFSLPSR